MAEPFTLELTDAPDGSAQAAILDSLRAFNTDLIGPANRVPLAVLIRNQSGKVLGGLDGSTNRGWLYIDMIFVPEDLRGQGLATRLIKMAEAEAIKRGCRASLLDTGNPEALRLYQTLGYSVFGELPDFANGLSVHYMHKRFDT